MMMEKKMTMVAYFSWSGNTRKAALQIHQLIGGSIFEIKPCDKYPDKYKSVLDIAKHEMRTASRPEIQNKPVSMEEYSDIFIGYPNWWDTFPAPITTFLTYYNFSGKTLIPFCTHGGGGIGHSISDMVKLCPDAMIKEVLSLRGKCDGYSDAAIENWLQKVR